MAKKLTRTLTVTEVTVKGVNHLTEQVEEYCYEVPGKYKDDKALEKAVKKTLPDGITFMYIMSKNEEPHKYVATEKQKM